MSICDLILYIRTVLVFIVQMENVHVILGLHMLPNKYFSVFKNHPAIK